LIRSALDSAGIPYSQLHGDIPFSERANEIKKFESGQTKVMLGNPQTGGAGINLIAGTIVVYYETDYRWDLRKQSEDRAHRQGQTKKVLYIDMMYKDSLDVDIYTAVRRKQNLGDYLSRKYN